jgi:hypothetical protein
MTLNEALDQAETANRALWDIIFSEPFPGEIVTRKTIVLVAFIDTALEHQSAITLLIRQSHHGSAMALVRSVYELMYRGAWAVVHASEDDAEKMWNDSFKWPDTGKLVTAADEAYGIEFFQAAKKSNWRSLNSFTHTGGLQVARRFTANDLQPNYVEGELAYAAVSTLIATGILALPFLRAHGRTVAADRLEKFLLEYSATSGLVAAIPDAPKAE